MAVPGDIVGAFFRYSHFWLLYDFRIGSDRTSSEVPVLHSMLILSACLYQLEEISVVRARHGG